MDYIRTTPVSDKFKTLTKPDLKIINQLKQLSFSGFEDVANRFLDTIATEIYSSAVTGKPFPQVVENIRASINGVYRRSNEEAVNRLVRIVEENRYSDDPLAKKKYLDARKILHSKYASDIRGENMRKYANQIAHDSIMQFDGQFTKYKGQEAGINTYKYTGTNITTTRQFCRAYLNEIKTEEEWREVFTGNWRGKSGSDPFVNRGGYRCRHSLIPYDPAWDDIEEVQEKVETPKQRRQQKINVINSNNVYEDNANVNSLVLNQVYRNFKGSEESVDRLNEFIKEKKTSIFFVTKSVRMEKIRRKELPKVNAIHKKTHGKDLETFGAKKRAGGNTSWVNESVNVFVEPSNKVNFNFADAKLIQEGVEELLDRRKKGIGKYTLKRGSFTTDLDWSVSSTAKGATKEIIEANKKAITTLHEIGHQVHYWATDALGNIAKSGKNYLTYYGAAKDTEFHAELFAIYVTNRKALAAFDQELVNYMDNLIDTAIKSKQKGSPVF
jgi:hypothetical protein